MSDVERQEPISNTKENVQQVKTLPNWKAPGTDRIPGYWIKHLKSLHDRTGNHLNECMIQANVPERMVEGRTTLIMKDPTKGIAVENYRPITCLNLLWKLLTSIFAEKTYKHLLQNELLPVEQKGCRKDSKGTKDQMIIDKMVMKNCKRRKPICAWHGSTLKRPMTWYLIRGLWSHLECLGSLKILSTCSALVWQNGKQT